MLICVASFLGCEQMLWYTLASVCLRALLLSLSSYHNRLKQERIASLTEEAGELRAMISHIEDQINTLVQQHDEMAHKKRGYEIKHKETIAQGREAAALHISAEVRVYISLHSCCLFHCLIVLSVCCVYS